MRMFSTPIPGDKKGKFFDFLREAEKADGAETPAETAQNDEMEIEFETSHKGIKSEV